MKESLGPMYINLKKYLKGYQNLSLKNINSFFTLTHFIHLVTFKEDIVVHKCLNMQQKLGILNHNSINYNYVFVPITSIAACQRVEL